MQFSETPANTRDFHAMGGACGVLMRRHAVNLLSTALFMFASSGVSAQKHSDWDTLWLHTHALSSSNPYYWMGVRWGQYTGLAYDRFRDVVYVVNPDLRDIGGYMAPYPRIHIWDARTGGYADSLGRTLSGGGGELPVPTDTVQGGYQQKRFSIYKVAVDGEGRIYACNLVSPLLESFLPPCPGQDTTQGPWKVYRWDTPAASPKLIYATLDYFSNYEAVSRFNTEMTWSRWGDAFEVVGKRGYESPGPGQPPLLVDSARIMVSGGVWCLQPYTNREVNIFLEDRRATRPFEFRLAVRMRSSLEGISSHGIAPTGSTHFADIWMDNAFRVTTLNNQVQVQGSWPQTHPTTANLALSEDSATGTGPSGPIAYIPLPAFSRNLLVCADGRPTDPVDPAVTNWNTTARLLDVTNPNYAYRFLGSTPPVGYNTMNVSAGIDVYNYISDVDYKLEVEPDSGRGLYIVLFVLMSNNGIAAFRTKRPVYVPVELLSFDASVENESVILRWETANETNNHGFEVQRSFDNGRNWDKIAFSSGAGTTSLPRRYSHMDPVTETHRSLGVVLYRLHQLDSDGSESYSQSVAARISQYPASLRIGAPYPQPASRGVALSFQAPRTSHINISIYSRIGERVAVLTDRRYETGEHTLRFDAGMLPSGIYVIRLLSADGNAERLLTVTR